MSRVRRLIKPAASAVIVLCVAWFFFAAFRRNWAAVSAHRFQIAPGFLLLAALGTLATLLLGTYAWHVSMNALSAGKIGFRQSVAATSVSGLTKYIPGKIWSYALQMYWLDGLGFSKALIVFVGLLNLLISLAVAVIFGVLCLLFARAVFPWQVLLSALLIMLALDAATILFNQAILKAVVAIVKRITKRELAVLQVRRSLLLRLHFIHALATLTSGLGIYCFCFAIGYAIDVQRGLVVIGSSFLGEVAGFLAIMVPGGLGVREGLMYALLGGESTGSLALVLPVASRILNMVVEVALGAVALRLLRSLSVLKARPVQPSAP